MVDQDKEFNSEVKTQIYNVVNVMVEEKAYDAVDPYKFF
jgi:hypothetical protein